MDDFDLSKAENKLTDTDPMPFGRYKGVIMIEVPVSFYEWMVRTQNESPRTYHGTQWVRVMTWLRSKGTDVTN